MATYEITAPDGKAYNIEGPEGASKEQLVRALQYHLYPSESVGSSKQPDSATKTFAKTLGLQQGPVAAGIYGFGAAAAPFAELGPISIIPGLVGAGVASYGASRAQDAILKYTGADKLLGVDEETMAQGAKAHPIASLSAELLSQFETFKPGLKGFNSISGALEKEAAKKGVQTLDKETADKLAEEIWQARRYAAGNAAIGAATDAAQQKLQGQDIDWTSVARQAALGAVLQNETSYGKFLREKGEGLVRPRAVAAALKTTAPSVKPIPQHGEAQMEMPLEGGAEAVQPDMFGGPSGAAEPEPAFFQPHTNADGTVEQVPVSPPATDTRNQQVFDLGAPPAKEMPPPTPPSNIHYDPTTESYVRSAPEPDNPDQTAFDFPTTDETGKQRLQPMEKLTPRDRILRALQISDETDGRSLREAAGLSMKDFIVGIGGLQKEGIVEYSKLYNEYRLKQEMPPRPEPDLGHREGLPIDRPVTGERQTNLTGENTGRTYFSEPVVEQKPNQTLPPEEPPPPSMTRSERAVQALRNGDIGEALNHLASDAGESGTHAASGVHPLRELADSLLKMVGVRENRSDIIEAELARDARETGRNRTTDPYSERERALVEARVNDPNFALNQLDTYISRKGDISPTTGKVDYSRVTPNELGRLLYKTQGNRFVLDNSGKRIPIRKLSVDRLVGKKVFGGAKVNVEREDMTPAERKVIERLKKEGKLAEYDPKTNTFHFTEAGLNDRTILHELVHGATVRVLHAFETNPESLSVEQREAAEHVNKIYKTSKSGIHGSRIAARFPDAFENVYEFVSHAATDEVFQRELSKIRVSDLGIASSKLPQRLRVRSLWDQFTYALAKMFNLDKLSRFNNPVNRLAKDPDAAYRYSTERDRDNALLQTSAMIRDLLASPVKGTEVKPLAAKKAPEAIKGYSWETALNDVGKSNKKALERMTGRNLLGDFMKSLLTHEGREAVITNMQNYRRPLRMLQNALRNSGRDPRNALDDYATAAPAEAQMRFMNVQHLKDGLSGAISKFMDKTGMDFDKFSAAFHLYGIARHEGLRRRTKFLMEAPLNNDKSKEFDSKLFGKKMTAADERAEIVKNATKGIDNKTAEAYRTRLEELARNYLDPMGHSTNRKISAYIETKGPHTAAVDEHSNLYNVAGPYDKEWLAANRDKYAADVKAHPELEDIFNRVNQIQEHTKQMNRDANYWPSQLDGLIHMYKYEDTYVPFKGDPSVSEEDQYDPYSKNLSGMMSEGEERAMGRSTLSENPLLRIMADSGHAAGRASLKKFTDEVVRMINDGHINADMVEHGITLSQRYNGDVHLDKLKAPDRIFHWRDDGKLDIYRIRDQKMLEAIKGFTGNAGSFWRVMNGITSGIGRLHTAYNPAFAPYNFVRHALTSAGFVGADFDPGTAARYTAAITSKIVDGGMAKAMRVARLLHANNIDAVRDLAKEHPFYQDMLSYLERGGRVSYQEAMNIHAQNESLMKSVGPSKIMSKVEHVNDYFKIWADTFELASRSAGYSVIKPEMLAREAKRLGVDKLNPADTQRVEEQAAQYVKNLFNFAEVGKYGREAGSVFMFLRPALTTAVRFHDSFAPMYVGLDTAVGRLPESVRDVDTVYKQILREKMIAAKLSGSNDAMRTEARTEAEARVKESIETFSKDFLRRKKNAQLMALGMAGAGMALHTMATLLSDTDSQGRNKVSTDNMAMWSRNIRLPVNGLLGKDTDYVQIPWGWGFGTFGSIGAQISGVVHGSQTIPDAISNIIPVAMESYLPLPVPKYSPVDHPLAFVVGAVTPTFARPMVEFAMNVDEFGQEIYTNRMNQFGDPYTGGEKLPPMYGQITEALADHTGVVMEPKTLHFFLNSYADGLARMGATAHGAVSLAMGERDFDPKQDLLPLSSFLGRQSSYDARQFAEMEKEVQATRNRLKMYNDRPEQLEQYINDHPNAQSIVQYYNIEVNGNLKQVREQMKQIERNPEISPREKAEYLRDLRENRDWIMRGMIDSISAMQ